MGPHKALVTHGHHYDVGWDRALLLERAQEAGADVVFFGHTHRPAHIEYREAGVSCFNPGSIALPRQFEPFAPTFLFIDLQDDGTIIPTFCYLGHLGREFIAFDIGTEIIE